MPSDDSGITDNVLKRDIRPLLDTRFRITMSLPQRAELLRWWHEGRERCLSTAHAVDSVFGSATFPTHAPKPLKGLPFCNMNFVLIDAQIICMANNLCYC